MGQKNKKKFIDEMKWDSLFDSCCARWTRNDLQNSVNPSRAGNCVQNEIFTLNTQDCTVSYTHSVCKFTAAYTCTVTFAHRHDTHACRHSKRSFVFVESFFFFSFLRFSGVRCAHAPNFCVYFRWNFVAFECGDMIYVRYGGMRNESNDTEGDYECARNADAQAMVLG